MLGTERSRESISRPISLPAAVTLLVHLRWLTVRCWLSSWTPLAFVVLLCWHEALTFLPLHDVLLAQRSNLIITISVCQCLGRLRTWVVRVYNLLTACQCSHSSRCLAITYKPMVPGGLVFLSLWCNHCIFQWSGGGRCVGRAIWLVFVYSSIILGKSCQYWLSHEPVLKNKVRDQIVVSQWGILFKSNKIFFTFGT